LAVLRFAAVRFLAVPRFAVLRFAAVFFFAVPRFAVDRLAVERLAAVRFTADRFLAPDFFALDFLAPAFFAEDLREEDERVERAELRAPERDEERVAAAMAGTTSTLDASPHSAAGASEVSLNEPAFDVGDVSPVPLQSSWVINDLLSWIARARFPTTFVCNVQRGRTTSCRTLLKR
jgi:hypothetical protein